MVWGMVVFFLCLLSANGETLQVQSLLCPSVCTAVVFFHLTRIISVFSDGITIYGTVLVSLERACLCHVLQAGHCASAVCRAARGICESALLGEHPEGASRGKGPLDSPKSTLVCPTWSRFVQGQTPCGRQSTALPSAALSQAYHAHCVAS